MDFCIFRTSNLVAISLLPISFLIFEEMHRLESNVVKSKTSREKILRDSRMIL